MLVIYCHFICGFLTSVNVIKQNCWTKLFKILYFYRLFSFIEFQILFKPTPQGRIQSNFVSLFWSVFLWFWGVHPPSRLTLCPAPPWTKSWIRPCSLLLLSVLTANLAQHWLYAATYVIYRNKLYAKMCNLQIQDLNRFCTMVNFFLRRRKHKPKKKFKSVKYGSKEFDTIMRIVLTLKLASQVVKQSLTNFKKYTVICYNKCACLQYTNSSANFYASPDKNINTEAFSTDV
jgi:hypothetical protein